MVNVKCLVMVCSAPFISKSVNTLLISSFITNRCPNYSYLMHFAINSWEKMLEITDMSVLSCPVFQVSPLGQLGTIQNYDEGSKDTSNCKGHQVIFTKPCLLLSWIYRALEYVAISHWSRGFWPMRNVETFPSKQMYLYLSLVERKVADFYHNTWLK